MTALNQRDTKWANLLLGFNKTGSIYTIGGYGCLITCISMVVDQTPDVVNEKLKSVNGFAKDTGLLDWTKVKQALPIDLPGWVAPYDNDAVKQQIADNGFCIVWVDFDGKISSPNDMHWVLYIGNGQLIDPWTGTTKSTGWYPIVKGYAPCRKIGVPTASDGKWIKDYMNEKGIDITNEGDARSKLGDVFDESAKYDQALKDKVKAQNELQAANARVTEVETENTHLKKDLQIANNDLIDKKQTVIDRDIEIGKLKQQLADAGAPVAPQPAKNWLQRLIEFVRR